MRLIDADALIQAIKKGFYMPTMASSIDRDYAIAIINEAPTIEPKAKAIVQITFDEEKLREIVKETVERFKEEYEITDRPQGEWKEYYDDEGWYCSECHKGSGALYNFCPNCGADMRKGEDNETDY